ncbi:MAG TPA: Gfo/Idh/MocA family oxidoreductase, partial [Phycisphaerae bacterium]|nr:Gfo/Idh/MocA family oxidoreductase [Phycisphaerae bacterium]
MVRKTGVSRRDFLKGAAAAVAAPYVLTSTALGAADRPAASERIVMGAIGVGGRGSDDMNTFLGSPEVQMVAVCDVFEDRRRRAKSTVDRRYGNADCAAYNDFRDLVTRPDIDAVCIGSPDHWHVLHALWAVRAGKDVYCEKPLGLSIEQDKALRTAVRRYGRVFQFGTQERSSWSTRLAAEIVLNGWIGKVHTIKVGTRFSISSPNYPPMPVPEGLDYDLWLGPAPW